MITYHVYTTSPKNLGKNEVQHEFLRHSHNGDITHNELTAQKPTYVLTQVIWEEPREGRQLWEGTRLCLGWGHGRRCEEEEEVEEVLPTTKNSQSKGCYFNYPQLEMRQAETQSTRSLGCWG